MCSEKVTHSHCQADLDILTVASRHICTCMGQDLWEDWLTKQLSRFLNSEAADGLQRL